ncbi:lysozyme [Acinetobacter proteolyticus]|uniref:Lysozyme n=1 Tax=Acinetobacter proteolyticus TaxID=1776741 RepID=A0A2N0WHK5_9GAMM|nr:lysozyme [Acinetobacter proteolyticus]PKF34909.1 lysozyme [Acinetobacter proteolyticus]
MKTILDYFRKLIDVRHSQKWNHAKDKQMNVATAYDTGEMLGAAFDFEMSISAHGINLITSFEDLKLNAYDDGTGIWTIGFGTTVYPNKARVKKDERCTLEQAKSFFQYDLRRFEKTVNEAVRVPISQNQFDALVSLAYNIGSNAFKNSTLLKYLNALAFQDAADQFLVWNKGGGKVLKGLIHRRQVERSLFLKK